MWSVYDRFNIVNGKECCYIHLHSSNQNLMPSTVKTNLYMRSMTSCIQMDLITALDYLSELKESSG
ncbi:rodent schlafen-like protein [Variola virus]|uniref:H3R n=1 Tax=Variola virus TaxID=10255 RepID=Q89486_VARV|nr:H3R [Variola virus]CAB54772.1 H3R protein [Variola minor virus]ABF22935.1 rodent schlafen-like protein [Variola virus]ABF23546.1 rodent schlafen-like protein [Variola virus]ABF24942.1 rodent schlafen-like protein [Variola virus]